MDYKKLGGEEKLHGLSAKSPTLSAMSSKDALKYASLITLTVQNAVLNLTIRMARTQKDLFIASTAVILAEIIKIFSCLVMIWISEKSVIKVIHSLRLHIINNPMDTVKVAVPSIVYYIQNNLLYVAATHLDAAPNQVMYQLKIITTALFSVALLNKRLIPRQWLALLTLFIGVALVSVDGANKKAAAGHHEQSPMTGFLAILSACVLSGFAGVYFEKILKGSAEVSLWIRNIQLAMFAIPFGLIGVFVTDSEVITTKGFFFGYSALTWFVVLLQAQGGLLVAVVVKYADNILKGFATSLAIIFSAVASVFLFTDFTITLQFIIGAGLVIGSIFLYSSQPRTDSILPQVIKPTQ